MNPDDIITSAFQGGGKMIRGNGLYVVEGNPITNELRTLPMDELYKNNIMAFTYSIHPGFVVLGVFTSPEAAEEHILAIRSLFRDEDENVRINQ